MRTTKRDENIMATSPTNKQLPTDPNLVQIINLAEVDVDRVWNSRKGIESHATDAAGQKVHGFEDLVFSIADEGQRDPVVMMPNPKWKAGDKNVKPLFLVSGFQRVQAIIEIAAGEHDKMLADPKIGAMSSDRILKLHSKEPTVRAFIKPLSPWEARKENIGENVQRNKLSTPDITYGVADLVRLNPALPKRIIANMLGKSEVYVGQLNKISESVKGKIEKGVAQNDKTITILEHWRIGQNKRCSIGDMLEVAEVDVDKQAALYLLKVGYKAEGGTGTDSGKKRGQGTWAVNAAVDARGLGATMKLLESNGALKINPTFFDPQNVFLAVCLLRKAPKKTPTDDQLREVANACEEGYSGKVASVAPVAATTTSGPVAKPVNGKPAKGTTAAA